MGPVKVAWIWKGKSVLIPPTLWVFMVVACILYKSRKHSWHCKKVCFQWRRWLGFFTPWCVGCFKRNLGFVTTLGSIFRFKLEVGVCSVCLLFTEGTNSNKGCAASTALGHQSAPVKQQSWNTTLFFFLAWAFFRSSTRSILGPLGQTSVYRKHPQSLSPSGIKKAVVVKDFCKWVRGTERETSFCNVSTKRDSQEHRPVALEPSGCFSWEQSSGEPPISENPGYFKQEM